MIHKVFRKVLQQSRLPAAFGCALILMTFNFGRGAYADNELPFDEVSVFFNVQGLGGKELEAVIQGQEVYLSVTGLFEYLKINNRLSIEEENVSGFFLVESSPYVIDKMKSRIVLGDKTHSLDPDDFIQTGTGIYLRSGIFGKVFGLPCVFNFRSLSVSLSTKLDLPVIRERRQEMMRSNLRKLKKEIQADTIIRTGYPAFNFGNFDWSVTSAQQTKSRAETRLNLRLGTILAGGEANVALNYDSRHSFQARQQHYLWRFVNNDRQALRQVKIGKIPVQSTASLFAPVVGVQLSNTPSSYRRSFGNYTLSDFTSPEWVVELYINNVLVDYVKADASGFFSFQVPMIYGNTAVKLRFFGPWGEERFKEQKINVPYNFLPKNELEYTFSAGMLEDGKQSRFSRLDLKYGLGNRITLGTGAEYLSGLGPGPLMPFANASVRLGSNLLLSADYTYGVRGKVLMNYRMPGELLLELNYTRYQKDQQAIAQNFLEERKAMISKPIRTQHIAGFSRLSIKQVIYPGTRQTTADLLLSASMQGVNVNLSTYAQIIDAGYLDVYSNLSLAFRLPSRTTIRPQVQYDYQFRRINEARVEIEKQVFSRGFLSLSYQNNFNYGSQTANLGARFDLSFARASFSARLANNRAAFSQSFSGGGISDIQANYFNMNSRSNVGKGGLVIYPFLDLNRNNRRDANEPKISGLKLKINGGRIQHNSRDTTIRVLDMEPYNSYLLEFNRSSFDNIGWQLKKAAFKVTVEPNKLKLIEVPVTVSGEAAGTVYGNGPDPRGQARIIVNFYRDGKFAGHTLSESDGYFSFLGLAPGSYTAAVDSAQLSGLAMTTVPATVAFEISGSADGDAVSDLDFRLSQSSERIGELVQPAVLVTAAAKNSARFFPEGSVMPISALKITGPRPSQARRQPLLPSPAGQREAEPADPASVEAGSSFRILVAAIGNRAEAQSLQTNLKRQYGHPVSVYFEGSNAYQLYLSGFSSRSAAEAFLQVLSRHNLKNARVIAPVVNENSALRYGLIAGKATHPEGLKSTRELISSTLQRTFFTVKDSAGYHLLIPAYSDRSTAEQDHRRLKEAGASGGRIYSYQEKQVKVHRKGTNDRGDDTASPRPAAEQGPTVAPVTEAQDNAYAPIVRYLVVAGEARNEESIAAGVKLIQKTLGISAFAVNENGITRFHISGFKDPEAAEAARRKLIAVGLGQGYIAPYRLVEVALKNVQ